MFRYTHMIKSISVLYIVQFNSELAVFWAEKGWAGTSIEGTLLKVNQQLIEVSLCPTKGNSHYQFTNEAIFHTILTKGLIPKVIVTHSLLMKR